VLTVPPSAVDPDALWDRFASIIGVDPYQYDREVKRSNASLGVLEVEFVRRLNAAIPDTIDWPTYSTLIKRQLAEHRLTHRPDADRLTTPPEEYGLKQRGYDVVGDLDDLRIGPPPSARGPQPADISDVTVLNMGFATLVELLAEWGTAKPHRLVLEDSAPESLGRLRRLLRHA
jgi:hypothetical protein